MGWPAPLQRSGYDRRPLREVGELTDGHRGFGDRSRQELLQPGWLGWVGAGHLAASDAAEFAGELYRRSRALHRGETVFDYDQPQLREGGCYPPEDGFCCTDGEFALLPRFFPGLAGSMTLRVHTDPRFRLRYPLHTPPAQAA